MYTSPKSGAWDITWCNTKLTHGIAKAHTKAVTVGLWINIHVRKKICRIPTNNCNLPITIPAG